MGLTRRQVAADMGASEGRWQAYENGARIPASRIWQFCRRYGLDVGDLYAGLPFTIGPLEPAAKAEIALMAGVAETGEAFEPAPGVPPEPCGSASQTDETMRAIATAAAELSPLERSLALAALRGMSAQKLKRP
jgi:transcriptional regulator with XRE-family HTH domain